MVKSMVSGLDFPFNQSIPIDDGDKTVETVAPAEELLSCRRQRLLQCSHAEVAEELVMLGKWRVVSTWSDEYHGVLRVFSEVFHGI